MVKVWRYRLCGKLQQKLVVLIFSLSWSMRPPTLQTFYSLHCAYAKWMITWIVMRISLDSIHLMLLTQIPLWQLSRNEFRFEKMLGTKLWWLFNDEGRKDRCSKANKIGGTEGIGYSLLLTFVKISSW